MGCSGSRQSIFKISRDLSSLKQSSEDGERYNDEKDNQFIHERGSVDARNALRPVCFRCESTDSAGCRQVLPDPRLQRKGPRMRTRMGG
jgi:hypothetical protein